MPFAVDDDNRDLALALAERVMAGVEMGLCTQILLGPPTAPRVSTSER